MLINIVSPVHVYTKAKGYILLLHAFPFLFVKKTCVILNQNYNTWILPLCLRRTVIGMCITIEQL